MHIVETKSILSQDNVMNIYRGCDHGCIYCDSRSLCYQINHDFEDIEVKINAGELLEKALISKRNPCIITTGSMSDPYNHEEEKLLLTRKCLEIINRYGFGLSIQTKSNTILRDLDLLKSINQKSKCVVQMTLTTFDERLCSIIEPNVSSTKERFEVLMKCQENNIPTVVWLTPLLPFINDNEENIKGLLEYCIKAKVKGIITFGTGLTLRQGNREYFYNALDAYFPGLKEKYIKTYHNNYELPSPNEKTLVKIIHDTCLKNNIMDNPKEVFSYMRQFPQRYKQESLF